MFADLDNFLYENMTPADWAHNLARLLIWLRQILVGPNGEGYAAAAAKTAARGSDQAHRSQSQTHGIFPDIWPDKPVYLDAEVANILLGKPLGVGYG